MTSTFRGSSATGTVDRRAGSSEWTSGWDAAWGRRLLYELASVSAQMAEYGITGVTDATPNIDSSSAIELTDAVSSGRFSQRLHLMCPPDVNVPYHEMVTRGPCKFMLDDDNLPVLDDFAGEIRAAHAAGSAVAVHCVTSLQLVLTVSALGIAGVVPGDRIEHASVVPPTLVGSLASLGVTVVTNPGFVPRSRRHVSRICRGPRCQGTSIRVPLCSQPRFPSPQVPMRRSVRRSLAICLVGP